MRSQNLCRRHFQMQRIEKLPGYNMCGMHACRFCTNSQSHHYVLCPEHKCLARIGCKNSRCAPREYCKHHSTQIEIKQTRAHKKGSTGCTKLSLINGINSHFSALVPQRQTVDIDACINATTRNAANYRCWDTDFVSNTNARSPTAKNVAEWSPIHRIYVKCTWLPPWIYVLSSFI